MGTRGFLGIRDNKELLVGRFNHYDSYYSGLGYDVLNYYFMGKGGKEIVNLADREEEDKDFLQDGLFCEYAYIYNEENDTLEIYRGFFETKQSFSVREGIFNSLSEEEKHFCHLIIIIDRKKHTKEKVLKAFSKYSDSEEEDREDYPERDVISLELNDGYVLLV